MYYVTNCVVCGSGELNRYPAVLAPFIAIYALQTRPFLCNLYECRRCSLRFFDLRLDEKEMGRLYSGYRGKEYFRVRHKHEFWYTKKINEGIGSDPSEIVSRQEAFQRLLRKHIDVAGIRSVLDFGGDRGQFIPSPVGREKYVFEISDAPPVAGVTRIPTRNDLSGRTFDLIMLCHVLEHCSSPRNVLEEARKFLAPAGSHLYVEVPYERTDLRGYRDTNVYRKYLRFLTDAPSLLAAVDLYSTLFRVWWNCRPLLGIVKVHEHLNFFEEKSLNGLMARCGLEVLASGISRMNMKAGVSKVLFCLAKRNDAGHCELPLSL